MALDDVAENVAVMKNFKLGARERSPRFFVKHVRECLPGPRNTINQLIIIVRFQTKL